MSAWPGLPGFLLFPRDFVSFSVIIPALNEATGISACIASARSQGPCQIIVVDGGSRDATIAQAQSADLVLTSAPGRARQMNAGAAQARGDHLLFLHADCQLLPGALAEARWHLRHPGILAGCFRMAIDAPGSLYRCIEACAAARVRLTGLVYGDQGLYLRRADFQSLGGFPPLRFMEDLFFARTLARLGRIVLARAALRVSPRRWRHAGLIRQSLRNWALTALAAGGVSPDRLAAYYPHVR